MNNFDNIILKGPLLVDLFVCKLSHVEILPLQYFLEINMKGVGLATKIFVFEYLILFSCIISCMRACVCVFVLYIYFYKMKYLPLPLCVYLPYFNHVVVQPFFNQNPFSPNNYIEMHNFIVNTIII